MLDCGTLGRAAVVRWLSGGLMGLCFDSELDPETFCADQPLDSPDGLEEDGRSIRPDGLPLLRGAAIARPQCQSQMNRCGTSPSSPASP